MNAKHPPSTRDRKRDDMTTSVPQPADGERWSPRRRICICTSRERALRQPFDACIAAEHDAERATR